MYHTQPLSHSVFTSVVLFSLFASLFVPVSLSLILSSPLSLYLSLFTSFHTLSLPFFLYLTLFLPLFLYPFLTLFYLSLFLCLIREHADDVASVLIKTSKLLAQSFSIDIIELCDLRNILLTGNVPHLKFITLKQIKLPQTGTIILCHFL